jgi:methionyl-tRNA formyltransferase
MDAVGVGERGLVYTQPNEEPISEIPGPRIPLKVGLLIDSFKQPRWVAAVLADLIASPAVEIVLLIVNRGVQSGNEPARASLRARMARWLFNRRYLLYALYERFDQWWFRSANDPLELTDVSELLRGIPSMHLTPRQTRHCDYFADEAIETIRSAELDVAIRLGFRILKGESLRIARHGVWSYHHGDNREYRGGPPCFWEVMEGREVTGAVVQKLSERLDDGVIVGRITTATDRFSVSRNREQLYWKAASILPRQLDALYRLERVPFDRESRSAATIWQPYNRRLYSRPANAEMLRLLTRLGARYVRERLRGMASREQWVLCYRSTQGPAEGVQPPATELYKFRTIVPPTDRYWADPFVVRAGSGCWIFAEEVVHREGKGRIVLFQIDPHGNVGEPVSVLERPYHLSYPFVFQWNGSYYMIPETRAQKAVELYRAISFPYQWEFDRCLLENVQAADATIEQIDGVWWMFMSVPSPHDPARSAWEELHVYHAASPLGPWLPHARNPVKCDVRNARPAGRFFRWQGRQYRPAQDSSRGYGSAIRINEVLTLTPDDFEEREVSAIFPSWQPGFVGTHTLNSDGGTTVVDAKWRGRRWSRRASSLTVI